MKGYYQTLFPSVTVIRGYNPMEPHTLAIAHPIAINPTTGKMERIFSGMVISTNAAGTAWVRGLDADATAAQKNTVAISQDDATTWDVMDATNTDVFHQPTAYMIGSLVGLSCSGQFRIASPYFARYYQTTDSETSTTTTHAYEYKAGTPLTPCLANEVIYTSVPDPANPGILKLEKVEDPSGFFRPATTGELVFGIVAETHNGANREDANHGTTVADNGALTAMALQKSIGKAVSSESVWYNAYYVVFDTNLQPVIG